MPNNLPSINLAGNKQIPLFDKFIGWSLTIGRLIVILTEVVAVMAFVYRFSLDERLVDLHSAIKQKQNVISVLKSDEDKYRNLQERIALAATFSEKAVKSSQTITDIANLASKQAKVNNLSINNDRVNIAADVSSVSSLADLIETLKNYKNIKSISIDNIENKPAVGLSTSITIMLK